MSESDVAVEVEWVANPFRGDAFADIWLPAAEAALDYGATGWAFFRAKEGRLDFVQWAFFPEAIDFDRYWYSEEIAAARAKANGLYQVPLLPKLYRIAGMGSLSVSSAREAPS
ncbi:MAG: hypothetical protein M3131_06230 [Actinomycetota bacterium]|nr:hypothetical protein [Actinomycetota bacterium]